MKKAEYFERCVWRNFTFQRSILRFNERQDVFSILSLEFIEASIFNSTHLQAKYVKFIFAKTIDVPRECILTYGTFAQIKVR